MDREKQIAMFIMEAAADFLVKDGRGPVDAVKLCDVLKSQAGPGLDVLAMYCRDNNFPAAAVQDAAEKLGKLAAIYYRTAARRRL